MQLVNTIREFQERIKAFLKEKKLPATTKRCCIRLMENELSFILIDKLEPTIQIIAVENLPYTDLDHLTTILADICDKYQLQKIPIFWLLAPEEYQLFLIESLPVERDELKDALNWRIRNLTNYPPDELVSDFFFMPSKQSSNKTLLAAIAAPKSPLAKVVAVLKKSGCMLTVIDISELALKNLTSMLENDEKSTAFIYFYKNMAILNISYKKTFTVFKTKQQRF